MWHSLFLFRHVTLREKRDKDMRHYHFLKSTCDIGGPPSRAPIARLTEPAPSTCWYSQPRLRALYGISRFDPLARITYWCLFLPPPLLPPSPLPPPLLPPSFGLGSIGHHRLARCIMVRKAKARAVNTGAPNRTHLAIPQRNEPTLGRGCGVGGGGGGGGSDADGWCGCVSAEMISEISPLSGHGRLAHWLRDHGACELKPWGLNPLLWNLTIWGNEHDHNVHKTVWEVPSDNLRGNVKSPNCRLQPKYLCCSIQKRRLYHLYNAAAWWWIRRL